MAEERITIGSTSKIVDGGELINNSMDATGIVDPTLQPSQQPASQQPTSQQPSQQQPATENPKE